MIGALMSGGSVMDPRSPTSVRFNEQVAVTEHVLGSPASTSGTNPATSAGNTGGAEPSGSMQGDPTSSQGDPPSFQPKGDANAGNSPSSTDSNRNNGNQGGADDSNDPQDLVPDRNYLDKLVFTYSATGGPLQHWGIESRIRAGDVVHFVGPDANLRLRSVQLLLRPDITEQVTNNAHFAYQHNDGLRVRTIVNGMSLFVLSRPNAARTPGNFTVLEDYVQSSKEICRLLVGHLEHADALAQEDLPLKVPLLFLVKEYTRIRMLSQERSNVSGKSMMPMQL